MWFVIGLAVGGIIGVFCMGLITANSEVGHYMTDDYCMPKQEVTNNDII